MKYAQLNEAGTYSHQITTSGNVAWDATHFCPASKLTQEEATLFRVVPLLETESPAVNTTTQSVMRDGGEFVAGQWQYKWRIDELFSVPADKAAAIAAALTTVKADLSNQIDAAVLAIYDRPMALSKEYEAREKAAADYKAAGYTGTVPTWLSSFATPAGLTATVAADLILSQALQMRNALDSLGALRMRKYEVQLASTEADARTAHTDIMAQIAAVAAGLD